MSKNKEFKDWTVYFVDDQHHSVTASSLNHAIILASAKQIEINHEASLDVHLIENHTDGNEINYGIDDPASLGC